MRLKLLSPGEMNEDQKKTYDESIASKRGSPPPPMMAWPGDGAARHPIGRLPALRYGISGKTVGDRHPGHRAALDLALRMVRPQAARAEGRHGSPDHRGYPQSPHPAFRRTQGPDDLRRRQIAARRPRTFQAALRRSREDAQRARAGRDHRTVQLLHHGVDDAEHV